MKKTKTISVLIPDGESNFLVHVINCLAQIKTVKIYVMSNERRNPMQFSRYIYHLSYYPKAQEDEWVSNINKELDKFKIDIIMPIFEDGIRKLIKYKHLFKNKLGLLPTFENFNTANNKDLLAIHLKANAIPCPDTLTITAGEALEENQIEAPLIIKPSEVSGGGCGIKLFSSVDDLNYFFSENKIESPYIVQNYIKGFDLDCSVLCKEGHILAYTIQKGSLDGDTKFEPKFGVEFLHETKLYSIVVKLMKSLNWSGVAHVDMRYDVNEGTFKVIEISPRYWQSLDASLIAGINFPYLYCLSSLDILFDKPKFSPINYLNLRGIKKAMKINKNLIFKPKFLWKNTSLKFALLDPLPVFFKFLKRI